MTLMEENIVFKPFQFPWAIELAEQHEDIHWTEKEINLAEDVTQWKNGELLDVEKEHITSILRLFTSADVIIIDRSKGRYTPEGLCLTE